jgi:calcium-dependent protein kinase
LHSTAAPLFGLLDHFRFGRDAATSVTGQSDGDVKQDYDIPSQASGTGRFGVVYKATCKKTGDNVAIKMIRKKQGTFDSATLMQEIDILKQLEDERTMRLIATYEDRHHLHIVSEWLDGGELFDRIIDLGEEVHSEADASRIMRDIFKAVKYLHSKNITHRDLKPENIMFRGSEKDSEIVLVDFGMSSVFLQGEKMSAQVGSPSYVAPEVLGGQYDESADLWSLGVIMYILLSGEPPFHGDSPSQIMRRVREGEYDMDQNTWRFISPSGKDMVHRLMTMDPTERMTLSEVMAHAWWDDAARRMNPLPANVVASIKAFEKENKIMRKAIAIIVRGIQDSPEFDNLRIAFEDFDHDRDGSITVEELGLALKTLEVVMNSDDLEAIVNEIDQDQDGRISFDEFLAAAVEKEALLIEEHLKKAFAYFDVDCSGKIDLGELFAITGDMDEARRCIKAYDLDKDGEMNFEGK